MSRRHALATGLAPVASLAACSGPGGAPAGPRNSPAQGGGSTLYIEDAWTVNSGLGTVETISWRPGTDSFAAGLGSGPILLCASDGTITSHIDTPLGFVSGLSWLSDGKQLLAVGTTGKLFTWPESPARSSVEGLPASKFLAVSADPSGGQFVISRGTGAVAVVSAGSTAVRSLPVPGELTAVAVSPDGSLVAVGNRAGLVTVIELSSGSPLWQQQGGNGKDVNALAWSPDGSLLAAGFEDSSLCLYQAQSGKLSFLLDEGGSINAVAWSPNGVFLAVSSLTFAVGLWHIPSHTLATGLSIGYDVNGLAWSPEGTLLVAGSDDHLVHAWTIAPVQGPAAHPFSAPGYMAR